MPRHKHIDIPGAVHHVIVRGLNRQDIFLDDIDQTHIPLQTGHQIRMNPAIDSAANPDTPGAKSDGVSP